MSGKAESCTAQEKVKYEPTIASLDTHPLPQWYAGAKLGIFIHWGLYSVPGWAPLSHPEHDFANLDYIKNNPYAEWYLNVMRIPGSPTQAYHKRTLRGEFRLLRLCSHLQPPIEEVESGPVGRDLPRCRRALCSADDEAPRWLHALAKHDGESESFDSSKPAARRA